MISAMKNMLAICTDRISDVFSAIRKPGESVQKNDLKKLESRRKKATMIMSLPPVLIGLTGTVKKITGISILVKKENWDYFESKITKVPEVLKPPFTSLNKPLDWLRTYFKCKDVPEETVRKLLIGYHCAIAELDERIGILLQKIDSCGLRDRTIFCYTSDHGEQLGQYYRLVSNRLRLYACSNS